jgi:hypothetical protein
MADAWSFEDFSVNMSFGAASADVNIDLFERDET